MRARLISAKIANLPRHPEPIPTDTRAQVKLMKEMQSWDRPVPLTGEFMRQVKFRSWLQEREKKDFSMRKSLKSILHPHTGQKTHKHQLTTGFCLQWEWLQWAFIPKSNNSAVVLVIHELQWQLMETWHKGRHSNFCHLSNAMQY